MSTSNLISAIIKPKSDLLTRKEAADYLGLKPRTLEIWASTGRYSLPFVKIGALVKYRKCDLDEFIQSRIRKFQG